MWIQWCLAYIVEAWGEKALWVFGVSSHKDIIPNRTAPPPPRPHLRLISSLRLHLQIPLHWRLRLQHKDLRKTYSFPVGILIEETSEQLNSCLLFFFSHWFKTIISYEFVPFSHTLKWIFQHCLLLLVTLNGENLVWPLKPRVELEITCRSHKDKYQPY